MPERLRQEADHEAQQPDENTGENAVPLLIRNGHLPIDVALIHVSPPDEHGFCSLGIEAGLVKTPAQMARAVIAEVNEQMPRTLGDSFIHISRINYAVPVDMLQRFVEGKDEKEEPPALPDETPPQPGGGAYVGIRLFKLSGDKAPAYVDSVAPNSPARAAGIRKDDLVLSVDQEVVRNCREYDEAVAGLKPGKEVRFLLKRGMAIVSVSLTPTASQEKPK